jgi:hypothetical protein
MDYESLKVDVAERLIRDYGKIALIVTKGANTGTPFNPVYAPETKDEVYFVETAYSMTDRNSSLVEVGDKMGLISTETGAVPKKSINSIEIDGIEYQLLDVQPLSPGGVVMLYKVHARK